MLHKNLGADRLTVLCAALACALAAAIQGAVAWSQDSKASVLALVTDTLGGTNAKVAALKLWTPMLTRWTPPRLRTSSFSGSCEAMRGVVSMLRATSSPIQISR